MTESRDWFTPYLPVPDPSTEVDEFNQNLRVEKEQQQ